MLLEELFQQQLEAQTGLRLSVKINDNCQTFLAINHHTNPVKISIHRIFLQAPEGVLKALSRYIIDRSKKMKKVIWQFVHDHFPKLNYSDRIPASAIVTQGRVHCLKEQFDQVNRTYFNGEVDLKVTWYGRDQGRRKSLNLGLYYDSLRLIKIHRMLDKSHVPDYFVQFVIYHEILHHVCPAYVDNRGRTRVHHDEFKRREKLFKDYEIAQAWLKTNKYRLF